VQAEARRTPTHREAVDIARGTVVWVPHWICPLQCDRGREFTIEVDQPGAPLLNRRRNPRGFEAARPLPHSPRVQPLGDLVQDGKNTADVAGFDAADLHRTTVPTCHRPILLRTTTELQGQGPISSVYGTHMTRPSPPFRRRRFGQRLCCRSVRCEPVGVTECPIELSVQASPTDQISWATLAQRCESVGCRALLVSDHPGSGPSPFVALAAAAAVTSTLRLGSYVINAGVHDPLLLARDVATLDVVSDGRAELGIGAGHTWAEWAMTGRIRPTPTGRIKRMISVTTVVRDLLTGHTVPAETAGGHADVQLTGPRPVQQPVPVLVGGGNPALLRWGGAHADAVGLSGLGRTLADGHAHTVLWSAAQLDTHVGLVRHGAAEAGVPTPPLEALVQHVELTDDRHQAARPFAAEADLAVHDVLAVPYVLIGTIPEIVEQLHTARDRWGITRWVVRVGALDVAEQILAALD